MPTRLDFRLVRPVGRRRLLATSVVFALFGLQPFANAQCNQLSGDVDQDRHVDLTDFASFADCMDGPGTSPLGDPVISAKECLDTFDADPNTDGDIDLIDFAEFQVTFTGAIRRDCHNVIFVSSRTYAPTLGSVAAYDAECNAMATAVGINNPTNTAFVAWVSSANSSAVMRLGSTVPGFVRIDSVPVAANVSSLIAGAILNPIRLDEFGRDVGAANIMTGTNANGSIAGSHCNNWTTTSGSLVTIGNSAAGPGAWTAQQQISCNQGPFRIYCIQKSRLQSLDLRPTLGKLVYLSSATFTPGGAMTPDQLCDTEKPSGVGSVRALISDTNGTASSVINPIARYVRRDGQVVGTGAHLIEMENLRSGIWQTATGSYAMPAVVWTGSSDPSQVGTAASSCGNWTTPSGAGAAGICSTTQAPSWWFATNSSCNHAYRLYCVEQ